MIGLITASYTFTWPRGKKKTNVKSGSPGVHWVRHHTHVAAPSTADIIRRRRVASPTANCEPCHQTSHQGHPGDTPDDTPRDSASIRTTLGRRRRMRRCPGSNSGLVASRARIIGSAACNFGRICDRAGSTVHKRCGSLALGTNTYRRHFAPMMHSIIQTAGAIRNDENEERLTNGSYSSWVEVRPKRYSCRRWDGFREAEG
jgi:hypothetical protein